MRMPWGRIKNKMDRSTRQRIHSLWDEISGFGASRTDTALEHMLTTLSTLIDAQHAYWMGTVRMPDANPRDPAGGWRVRSVRYLEPSPKRDALRREHIRRLNEGSVDPSITALLREAGRFRVLIKHEIVDEGWYESDFYHNMIKPLDIRDMSYAVTPLGSDVESWFIFSRIGADIPCFGDAERDILSEAVRPVQWFQRQLLLHNGVLLANASLTNAERKVLSALLSDQTEAEIAKALHLAASTVHTYCTRICRKFNVRGRAGLIALWLGKTSD